MTTALDSSFFEFWIWTNHISLLSIATNHFASFCIDIRSRHCYFRVCKSGEIWNKMAFFPYIFVLLFKTNRFHVAVRLFSNRPQRTSKCGKNISDTLSCASCATFFFLPHFDVLCDLLLNRSTATWNLFVKYMSCWYLQDSIHIDLTLVTKHRAVFKWLSKVITWLRLLSLMIGLKDSRQFFSQWDAKPKPIPPRTRDFSRALTKF